MTTTLLDNRKPVASDTGQNPTGTNATPSRAAHAPRFNPCLAPLLCAPPVPPHAPTTGAAR